MPTITTSKPYDLSIEVRNGYLHAYVKGQHDTLAISTAYWTEIRAKLTELGVSKVMIVEDIIEESPILDVYFHASQLADLGFGGVKVAFVDRHSSHKEQNDFAQLVGTNSGLNGRAFVNEAEAEKWLLAL
jgi:hypothetical protein